MKISKEPKQQAPYKKEKDPLHRTCGKYSQGVERYRAFLTLLPGSQISQSVWRRENKEVSTTCLAVSIMLLMLFPYKELKHLNYYLIYFPQISEMQKKAKYNY